MAKDGPGRRPARTSRDDPGELRKCDVHGGTKLKTYLHTPKFSSTGALSCLLDWSATAVGQVKSMGLGRRLRGYEVPRYVQYAL